MIGAHGRCRRPGPARTIDLSRLTQSENRLLDQVAAEIRRPYNDLVARIADRHAGSAVWLFSSLASRHTTLSSTFIRCCELALVRKLIDRGEPLAEVVTDSPAMRTVLERMFAQCGVRTKARCARSLSQRIGHWLLSPRNLAASLRHVVTPYLLAKICRRGKNYSFSAAITLLDTFVVASSFDPGTDAHNDRYYPGFLDALTRDEKGVTYYLPTFVGIGKYWPIFRKLRSDANRFLLKEDFLRLSDYLMAFLGILRVRLLARSLREDAVEFAGVGMHPLLSEEIRTTCANYASILAFLNYRLMRRLRERKIPIRLVVDWNENQVIDRGLTKGVHDFYPGTPVVGYQGFIVSPLYHIYLQPTESEVALGVIPDEIAVVGEGLVARTREFCPTLPVIVAPAARFEEVWRDRPPAPAPGGRYILIALSIAFTESIELLRLVAEAVRINGLEECKVVVKRHPVYSEQSIIRMYGGTWPARFRFGAGNIHDCLDRASMLIGNTSSTCVEALARGIPVIVVGSRSGLTQNPIPQEITEHIWRLCHTAEEVAAAVAQYLARTPEEAVQHARLGREIRARYFEPTTRESIRRFLRLAQ